MNDNTSTTEALDTSFQLTLVEDTDISDKVKYDNAVGLTAGSPKIVAHNYNFTTLNKDGTTDPTATGYDIGETSNYGGGRLPRNVANYQPSNPQSYTEPVSSITRIGFHNQGEEYFFAGQGDTTFPYNAGTSIKTLTNNQGSLVDGSPLIDLVGNGAYADVNALNTPVARAINQQQKLEPNTDLYIKSTDGKPIRFYFTDNIASTGAVWDGRALAGSSGAVWDFTAVGTGAQVPILEESKKPTAVATGMMNYIIGIKNGPDANFEQQCDPTSNQLVPRNNGGIWYGCLNQEALGTANSGALNPDKTNDTKPDGIKDLRIPLSQFNTETYARFTNSAGESEVMYIKFHPYDKCIFNNKYNDTTALDVADQSGNQTNNQLPLVFTGGFGTDPSVQIPITHLATVPFFILKRDCEGKGKKAFIGTNGVRAYSQGLYEPTTVRNQWGTTGDTGRQGNQYFELLNGWSMMEHRFKVDNALRDIIPTSNADFRQNLTYSNGFGEVAPIPPTTKGRPCGADMYLVKYANMPITDTDGLLRMTDNTIRLNTMCVKRGEPTRQVGNTYDTAHTGKYTWQPHYDYIDLSLAGDKNYFSPTDIANLLTKQLHKPANIYKSWDTTYGGGGRFEGGYWEDSAGNYPMNSLFRTIHGPSNPSVNTWDTKTGMLNGSYHEGDFCFDLDISQETVINGINAFGWCKGELKGYADGTSTDVQVPNHPVQSGKHRVWIQNNDSYLNTIPSSDSYAVKGYALAEKTGPYTVRTLMDSSSYHDNQPDKNIKYSASSTFAGQFIGTNNAQLNFNTDFSRFEWKFLHQPKYSEYQVDSTTGATNGGNIVATIWAQNIKGSDNWDRYGGINVVNWTMPDIVRGTYTTRRDIGNVKPLTDQDPIGLAFMNKLGFSSTWISENSGSTDYTDTKSMTYKSSYKPLGTTRSDFDVSESKPYTQVSLRILGQNATGGVRTKYPNIPVDAGTKLNYLQTDTVNSSLGGQAVDTTLNTTYHGSAFFGKEQTTAVATQIKLKEVGATLGYGMVATTATPPSTIYKAGTQGQAEKVPTDLNLDDVKYPNYEIEVDSNSLVADELPKKTVVGYFLIMSDIIDKHEFIGSANGGGPLKCIGILSKNYENNDFYFSFQSPVEFHVKQDRTITSIRTTVVNPDLSDIAGLDFNSSIIYSIVRQQALPEPDVPPMSVQQALDYEVMEQMANQLGVDMNLFNPQSAIGQMGIGNSGGANLNTLRQNVVSAVLNPTRNSASVIARNESEINSNISRMPLHQRGRAMIEAGLENTDQIVGGMGAPTTTQAQMEGLGIAEPVQNTPAPYLSMEQLEIEHANLVKKGDSGSPQSDTQDPFMPRDPREMIGGTLGPNPFGAVRDDDAGSVISAKSYHTESDLFQFTDPSEYGVSAPEAFASSSGKGEIPAVSLPTFFSKFVSVANQRRVRELNAEMKIHGLSVDNPNTWRLPTLKAFSGPQGNFDWGDAFHKRIGAKLNLEARNSLSMAMNQKQGQSATEQKAGIEQAVSAQTASSVMPESEFGLESLRTRVSRTYHKDPLTRQDQKDLGATAWSHTQNPYDLRTWGKGTLNEYIANPQFGVPLSARTESSKLSKGGFNLLSTELKRRSEGGRAKNANAKNYDISNYDPTNKHKTPHASVGNVGGLEGKAKVVRRRTSAKESRVKLDNDMIWSEGYIKGHTNAGAQKFDTHQDAYRYHLANKTSATGITRANTKGKIGYELRGGPKGQHKTITKLDNDNKQQHSYLFEQQKSVAPRLIVKKARPQQQQQQQPAE
jgi:hypothetical protein